MGPLEAAEAHQLTMADRKNIDWDSYPLGDAPDHVIAKAAGVTAQAACDARRRRDIPAHRTARPPSRTDKWKLSIRKWAAAQASSPLARARTELGFTQVELGAISGLDHTTISVLERGAKPPTRTGGQWSDAAMALSSSLGADPQTLFPDADATQNHYDLTCLSEATEAFAACGATYQNSRELIREVAFAMRELTPVQQRVLEMRFGLRSGEPMLLREAGVELGVSRERIRQIEEVALCRLRELLEFRRASDEGTVDPSVTAPARRRVFSLRTEPRLWYAGTD